MSQLHYTREGRNTMKPVYSSTTTRKNTTEEKQNLSDENRCKNPQEGTLKKLKNYKNTNIGQTLGCRWDLGRIF